MAFLDEKLLARARDFIHSSLRSGEGQSERPVVIVYHGDGDGCCAAYFLERYIRRPALFYWVATPDFDFAKAEDHISEQNPLLSIFLDMPVTSRPEMIDRLSSAGHVFIYDHHQPGMGDRCNSKDTVLYINPVIHQNGEDFPAVLFGWELLTEKAGFEKEVLFMGLFTETWLEQAPLFKEFSSTRQDLLKEVAKRVHGSFLIHETGTTHYALQFLFKASTDGSIGAQQLETMREYRILEDIYDLIQNEKTWLMMRLKAEIRRLTNPSFILKKIESRMRLCGLLASELRWSYPHLVIGIWQKWEHRFLCELRRGRHCGINLAALIEGIKREVNLTTGGGHPAAAAFTAEDDDFFEALDRVRHQIMGQ
jgi:single-stranded DNA-specific DHH superfamily exonuclease